MYSGSMHTRHDRGMQSLLAQSFCLTSMCMGRGFLSSQCKLHRGHGALVPLWSLFVPRPSSCVLLMPASCFGRSQQQGPTKDRVRCLLNS